MKAILLDLDDTLLGNALETFVSAYFQALAGFVGELIPAERLVSELLNATRAMQANEGGDQTNQEVFAEHFYPALGWQQSRLEPVFDRFYAEAFPALRSLTTVRPEARRIIELAQQQGLQVVIATNPLFPATAIEQRLHWAGVPVSEYCYDLVTTYECMHATKSSPAYYQEILARIGRRPEECLMAGDDWHWDVEQPTSVGIPAFWIAEPAAEPPAARPVLLQGQGPLTSLAALLE